MTLEQVLEAIDQMSLNDLETVKSRIEQARMNLKQPGAKDPEAWLKALDESVEAMRAGLTEEALDRIVDAMNGELDHQLILEHSDKT